MSLAYEYPLLGAFFTMMWFFLFVVWIMALFHVIADIFRSRDLGGFAKVLWLAFVVITPFLGVFVYLIARSDNMTKHAVEDTQAREVAFQGYVQQAVGTSPATELSKLAALRDSGHITDAEYEAGKSSILG